MSMGRMAWEGNEYLGQNPQFMPDYSCWWQEVLESDWATEQTIMNTLGPEYYFAWRSLEQL